MDEEIKIGGFCDPKFEEVKKTFISHFVKGWEDGASFAVTMNGKFVVDLWAGYADEAHTKPWEKDTIVCVYSTTKVMAVICGLILSDRGLLDFEAPVSKYWPEFAQNGKETIPVKYIFAHMSGLAGFEEVISAEDYYDWEKMTKLLAEQKPWWEPGTKAGYHAITQGYLIGELIRRITGKSLRTFFREEIAEPLKADFHIGLLKKDDNRVAELVTDPKHKGGSFLGMFRGIANLANKSSLVKEEIGDWEKKFQIEAGGEDVCFLKTDNNELFFEEGKIENPDGILRTPKNRSNMIFLLFPHINETLEFITQNLQIEGKPEDIDKIKRIFNYIITDAMKKGSIGMKMYLNAMSLRRRTSDWAWKSAEIPAVNGHGNARSSARIGSIIACKGEVDGIRFLSEHTCANILMEEQFKGIDVVNGGLERYGMGLGLKSERRQFPNYEVSNWGGTGGSRVIMDQKNKLSFAYIMNRMRVQIPEETKKNIMISDTRANNLAIAVYKSLGQL
ncbi:MAG: serine hydrolase domain-containing protein [Promethearchaeota archaeon]